jgi:hypothetical protein
MHVGIRATIRFFPLRLEYHPLKYRYTLSPHIIAMVLVFPFSGMQTGNRRDRIREKHKAADVTKKKKSQFQEYLEGLPECDQLLIKNYFTDLFRHIALSREYEERMRGDFEKALMYYSGTGVDLHAALERIQCFQAGRILCAAARPVVSAG